MLLVTHSVTDRGDGTSLAVVSPRPGVRLQLVVWSAGLTAEQLRETINAVATTVERKGTR